MTYQEWRDVGFAILTLTVGVWLTAIGHGQIGSLVVIAGLAFILLQGGTRS